MPCRALEAFRHFRTALVLRVAFVRLNALSGIGGVQTTRYGLRYAPACWGLNALSGIGGVQTWTKPGRLSVPFNVLMPCRALEAFRRWGRL